MSRILRRPMFKKGGSTGEGIMSKVEPRQGYNLGQRVVEIEKQISPLYERAIQQQRDDTLANFLTRGGLNLIAGSDKDASTLQALSGAYRQPLEQAIKDRQRQDQMQTQGKLASLGAAVKIAASQKPEKKFASQTLPEIIKNVQNALGENTTTQDARRIAVNLATKVARAQQSLGLRYGGILPIDRDNKPDSTFVQQQQDGTYVIHPTFNKYYVIDKDLPGGLAEVDQFTLQKIKAEE